MNLANLKKELEKVKINNLLIKQNNNIIFEYCKNKKQKDKIHHLNSCTKSVLSILFGIAYDQKLINSLDIPISEFFSKYYKDISDPRKYKITVRNLLTMTDGLHFPEFGEWNCFSPMRFQSDMVGFVLNREVEHEPGTHMNYSSGSSHLLSSILQQIAGQTVEDFAKEYLFKPLGIKDYKWYKDKQNINFGADGLGLKIDDMIKIGELMLANGIYNSQKVVSKEWVQLTTQPLNLNYKNIGYYGMHWWVNDLNENQEYRYYYALGFGGQFIIVNPNLNIVIVITSELYNDSLKPLNLTNNFMKSLL